jgi:hypothetical protein
MHEGKVKNFQQCVKVISGLEIKYGLYRLNEKQSNPYKSPREQHNSKPGESKQDNQGWRGGKGKWGGRGKSRGKSHNQADSSQSEPTRSVQVIAETIDPSIEKAKSIFDIAKQSKRPKSIAGLCDAAVELLDAAPSSQESNELRQAIKDLMVSKNIHGTLNHNPALIRGGRGQGRGRGGGRGSQGQQEAQAPQKPNNNDA